MASAINVKTDSFRCPGCDISQPLSKLKQHFKRAHSDMRPASWNATQAQLSERWVEVISPVLMAIKRSLSNPRSNRRKSAKVDVMMHASDYASFFYAYGQSSASVFLDPLHRPRVSYTTEITVDRFGQLCGADTLTRHMDVNQSCGIASTVPYRKKQPDGTHVYMTKPSGVKLVFRPIYVLESVPSSTPGDAARFLRLCTDTRHMEISFRKACFNC